MICACIDFENIPSLNGNHRRVDRRQENFLAFSASAMVYAAIDGILTTQTLYPSDGNLQSCHKLNLYNNSNIFFVNNFILHKKKER